VAVQVAFAALSLIGAVALTFSLGPVSHAANQTTVRVVGAALFALGYGAAAAARDPAGNRIVLPIEIVFTALSAAEIVRKLVVDRGGQATTWLLLGALVAGLALLLRVAPAAGIRMPRRLRRHESPAALGRPDDPAV
jgi:hypothetical protein